MSPYGWANGLYNIGKISIHSVNMMSHLLLSAVYADGDHGCLDVTPLDDHLDVDPLP